MVKSFLYGLVAAAVVASSDARKDRFRTEAGIESVKTAGNPGHADMGPKTVAMNGEFKTAAGIESAEPAHRERALIESNEFKTAAGIESQTKAELEVRQLQTVGQGRKLLETVGQGGFRTAAGIESQKTMAEELGQFRTAAGIESEKARMLQNTDSGRKLLETVGQGGFRTAAGIESQKTMAEELGQFKTDAGIESAKNRKLIVEPSKSASEVLAEARKQIAEADCGWSCGSDSDK